jgi:hypothetical protein
LGTYQKRVGKLQQRVTALNFSDAFERRTREKYLLQLQRDRAAFGLQLELIKNVVTSIQARETYHDVQETHHHVEHIAIMQAKMEWLEVFFASYYAAALAHYISHDNPWIIGGAVIFGILLALCLQKCEIFVGWIKNKCGL